MLAEGTNSSFSNTATTHASERAIWSLWRNVGSWERWDGGLKSASLEGPFCVGATGTIVPRSGPAASFRITEVTQDRSYTFETSLPLGTLTVTRRFLPRAVNGQTRFEHKVAFSGLLGWFWASQFGPGFRRQLPPTMERLARLAEQS
ncbi:MAG: SRPBCC family protein [Bosea sp. (in: a-proteobacteria)]